MLEHIAQGVTDVEVLAGQARGALRKKLTELKESTPKILSSPLCSPG
jgi:hypothetical protein